MNALLIRCENSKGGRFLMGKARHLLSLIQGRVRCTGGTTYVRQDVRQARIVPKKEVLGEGRWGFSRIGSRRSYEWPLLTPAPFDGKTDFHHDVLRPSTTTE
jgi:hypothetical protein